MSELLWIVFMTAAGTLGVVASSFELRRRSWRQLAADLGLEVDATTFSVRLRGHLRGFKVGLSPAKNGISIEVSGVHPGFTFRRETGLARAFKPDVEIGDPSFDDRVRVEGDTRIAQALLDEETRRQIEILVVHGAGSLSGGTLRRSVPTIQQAAQPLRAMLELAARLRSPSDKELPDLLARQALEGGSLGVRLQAFRRLRTSFPRSEILSETARKLRTTWDVPMRLEACRVLLRKPAPEGAGAAEELMKLAQRDHIDSSSRRSALEWVARSIFRKEHVPSFAKLLRDRDGAPPEVRIAALEALARSEALPELLSAPLPDDAAEAEALAGCLGRLGEAAAQPRLLQLLRHSRDTVRAAAAEALGAVGDARAVEPLREASSGVLGKLALGREADSAIARIQARLGGAQAGEISMVPVGPLEGAVSRADDRGASKRQVVSNGGEVSLT